MNTEQLWYDLTDLALITLVMASFSLMAVGFYTVIKTIVEWVSLDIYGRWFKRRARRSVRRS